MILLISYDLNGHERPSAYDAVKEIIEDNAISFKRPLYSQWLVETEESTKAWSDLLTDNDYLDKGDYLFIVQVQKPYNGWLPKSIWPWLKERI